MNKYLTTGVAAIAFIVAFTSCSKTDLYDQGAVDERNRQEQEKKDQQKEMTVNEKYAFAFEKAFGKVGPNVDWGFGRKNSSARAVTLHGIARAALPRCRAEQVRGRNIERLWRVDVHSHVG